MVFQVSSPQVPESTPATNVGMNHFRSLGLSAGRKNARICQRMNGEVATMEVQNDTLNGIVNGSMLPMTLSCWPFSLTGRKSLIGQMRMLITVGAAR